MRYKMGYYKYIMILPVFLIFVSYSNADTIYLKNGRSIEGFILREETDIVELEVSSGMAKFQRKDIERITISTPEDSAKIRAKWEKSAVKRETIKQVQEHQPKSIELAQNRGHIVIEALVNNKAKAMLFLDTGASLVILSESVAKKSGINLDKINTFVKLQVADGRQVNAKYIVLTSLSVQGIEAKGVEAAVIPDANAKIGVGDGLLGMSFLKRFNFKVDYNRRKLILERL